jgi:alanine racemase
MTGGAGPSRDAMGQGLDGSVTPTYATLSVTTGHPPGLEPKSHNNKNRNVVGSLAPPLALALSHAYPAWLVRHRGHMSATPRHHAGGILTIDLAAIRANYALLAERLAPTPCAAVVKADAYGLGAIPVARTLASAGCRKFFVAHLDEALALKPHLPSDRTVYVLHGIMPGAEADALAGGVIPVINSLSQLAAWGTLGVERSRRLAACLQVDTGMARLGLSPDDVEVLHAARSDLPGVALHYVVSHLVSAENAADPMNQGQLARLKQLLPMLPPAPVTFANSSGVFLGRDYHFDLGRPGAALYGVNPQTAVANPMRAVVRLQGKVIQVRRIEAGTSVGYNATWQAARTSRIATVAIGYADGLLRSLSGRTAARIANFQAPLVGRVSMDTVTLDVTDLPEHEVGFGTLATFLDTHYGVDALAADAGTNGYEILTSLGSRYHREYLNP